MARQRPHPDQQLTTRMRQLPAPLKEMAPLMTPQQQAEHEGTARGEHAPLDARNRGYGLLCRMGWRGGGLGKRKEGGQVPVAEMTVVPAPGQRGVGWISGNRERAEERAKAGENAGGPMAPRQGLIEEMAQARRNRALVEGMYAFTVASVTGQRLPTEMLTSTATAGHDASVESTRNARSTVEPSSLEGQEAVGAPPLAPIPPAPPLPPVPPLPTLPPTTHHHFHHHHHYHHSHPPPPATHHHATTSPPQNIVLTPHVPLVVREADAPPLPTFATSSHPTPLHTPLLSPEESEADMACMGIAPITTSTHHPSPPQTPLLSSEMFEADMTHIGTDPSASTNSDTATSYKKPGKRRAKRANGSNRQAAASRAARRDT